MTEKGKDGDLSFELPKADGDAVRRIITSPEVSLAEYKNSMLGISLKYPYLKYVLEAVNAVAVAFDDESEKTSFTMGILLSLFVLDDAQSRTGGTLPDGVNRDLLASYAASLRDRGSGYDHDYETKLTDFFNKDPQLYFGLSVFSLKGGKNDFKWLFDGAYFMRGLLIHSLESQKLETQFPPFS